MIQIIGIIMNYIGQDAQTSSINKLDINNITKIHLNLSIDYVYEYIDSLFNDMIDMKQVSKEKLLECIYLYVNTNNTDNVVDKLIDKIFIKNLQIAKETIGSSIKLCIAYWNKYKTILYKLNNIFTYVTSKDKNQQMIIYKLGYTYFLKYIIHANGNELCQIIIDEILSNTKFDKQLTEITNIYTKFPKTSPEMRNYQQIFETKLIEKIQDKFITNKKIDEMRQNIIESHYKKIDMIEKYINKTLYDQIIIKIKIIMYNKLATIFCNIIDNENTSFIKNIITNYPLVINKIYCVLKINESQDISTLTIENIKTFQEFNEKIVNYFSKIINEIKISNANVFMTEQLLLKICNLYDYFQFIMQYINHDEIILNSINNLFTTFMGQDNNIIKYLIFGFNTFSKKYYSTKEKSYDNLIIILKKIFELFKDEEIFKTIYIKYLKLRLLTDYDNIIDLDYERSHAKDLGKRFGIEFIDNIYMLIDDIDNSKYLTSEYKKLPVNIKTQKFKNIEFDREITNFTVLSNIWDSKDEQKIIYSCTPPNEIDIYEKMFNNIFTNIDRSKQNNCDLIHNLHILHDMSEVILELEFDNEKYIIKTSASQSYVLLLFNDTKMLTSHQIERMLNIPMDNLNYILNSLVNIGIIIKNNENYTYNENFESEDKTINAFDLLHS